MVLAVAAAAASSYGFHQTRSPVMGCTGHDSPQKCREKARNMVRVSEGLRTSTVQPDPDTNLG